MKPRLLLPILCVLLTIDAYAQDIDQELEVMANKLAAQIKENGKKKATVVDFADLQGGATELGKYIAEQLTINLVSNKRDFSVLDRANLKRILAEHKLTASGLVDPENAKKLGQFAGVDALILGTIIPKTEKISLTAKIITTDTAEIVGAARIEFATNQFSQQLLSQAAKVEDTSAGSKSSSTKPSKPFGDLQAWVESMNLLPGDDIYGFARMTLVISNTSSARIYGVALHPDFYNKFTVSNSRGDEFRATEVSGVETAFESGAGEFRGSVTDISPNTAISIVAKSQVRWTGKPGEYRPYRLQTVVVFGEERDGRHPNLRKHNLVLDVK